MDNQTMYFLALEKIRHEGWCRIPNGHAEAFLRYAAENGGPDGLDVQHSGEFARISRPPTVDEIRRLIAACPTSASLPEASREDD